MNYRVDYKRSIFHDLKRIDRLVAERIIRATELHLGESPDTGEARSGQFRGLHNIRIGDWRVIYAILPDSVLVLRVRHRSAAYQ